MNRKTKEEYKFCKEKEIKRTEKNINRKEKTGL